MGLAGKRWVLRQIEAAIRGTDRRVEDGTYGLVHPPRLLPEKQRYEGPFACSSRTDGAGAAKIVYVGAGYVFYSLQTTEKARIAVQGDGAAEIDLTAAITANGDGTYFPYFRFHCDSTNGNPAIVAADRSVNFGAPMEPDDDNGTYVTMCEAVVVGDVIVNVKQVQYGYVYCQVWRIDETAGVVYKTSLVSFLYPP